MPMHVRTKFKFKFEFEKHAKCFCFVFLLNNLKVKFDKNLLMSFSLPLSDVRACAFQACQQGQINQLIPQQVCCSPYVNRYVVIPQPRRVIEWCLDPNTLSAEQKNSPNNQNDAFDLPEEKIENN